MAKKPERPRKPESVTASPRHKQREGKQSGPIPTYEMGPHEMSVGVPDNVKIAIAATILAYSAMEASLEAFIWDITGLSYDDGKLLTRVEASEKILIAKTLAERYGVPTPKVPQNTPTMWRVMHDLSEVRNKIAHGVWGMHRLETPMASSFRMKGDLDRVISESFSIPRLEAITRQCDRVKGVLDRMCQIAQALRQKLVEQFLKESTKTRKRPSRTPKQSKRPPRSSRR
jgi:hypothetical protein